MAQSHDNKYLDKVGVEGIWSKITSLLESAVETLTGLISQKQDALTFDSTPTANSSNPVTSGGIKTALDAKQNAITVTTNTTDPTDDDTIIMQANGVSNTTTFLRRKLSYLWNYIQSKISSVLGLTSTNYGGTSAKATSDASGNVITTTYATLTDLAEKRDKYRLTSSWIGQNVAGSTYGVACRFKLTSVSETRSIYMRINARNVIHNLRILASSSSLSIANMQIGTHTSDNAVYGYLDTATGIVTIYLYMKDYREGASVTEFSPANYYYYNSRLTDIEFPNKKYVSTLPTGYVTASQVGWARYDKNGNDISTYYQPALTLPLSVTNGGTGASDTKSARLNLLSDATEAATDTSDGNYFAFRYQTPSADNGAIYYRSADKVWNWIIGKITAGTGLVKSNNTINHSNSIAAQTSDLGSGSRIPVIRYDAQGHITKGSYVSVFTNEVSATIKCGYINHSTSGTGWFKVGQMTGWKVTYNRLEVLISVMGTSSNVHDYGLLRIRGNNSTSVGVITGMSAQWIIKTPKTNYGFDVDCIRLTKTETGTSDGATINVYMLLPSNNIAYNFMVVNECSAGTTMMARNWAFSNSTAKETTEPSPTYASTMAPLNIGNHSNCLEITDSNWQSYLTASNGSNNTNANFAICDILTIPEGTSQIFFNTTNTASIALVRGAGSINRFPRNGVRITIAGNWKPQEGGGYSGALADGRFSAWLYTTRSGVISSVKTDGRLNQIFEDFIYFNGVWYSKGY